jgi:hypothetical protein
MLKNLNRLSLNSCISLTSSDVASVIGAVPKLQSLSMAGYFPSFVSTTLIHLDELSGLISLNLELNPAVNDHVLDVITSSCRRIEELNLTGAKIL